MKKRRHPLENTNPKLETDTLIKAFEAPILLITYDGIQKVTPKQIETYEIHTRTETLHKTELLYAVSAAAATEFGEYLRINTTVQEQNLRTAYTVRERGKKVINSKMLRRAVSRPVKVTMRNGHVLYGQVVDYNAYNFIMKVNAQQVLVYKHAVYEFLVRKSPPR